MEWGWSADAHFPALVRPSVVDAHAPHQRARRYQPTDAAHAHQQGMPLTMPLPRGGDRGAEGADVCSEPIPRHASHAYRRGTTPASACTPRMTREYGRATPGDYHHGVRMRSWFLAATGALAIVARACGVRRGWRKHPRAVERRAVERRAGERRAVEPVAICRGESVRGERDRRGVGRRPRLRADRRDARGRRPGRVPC